MQDVPANPNPAATLVGGGAMGDAVRAFDWAGTSLGPISAWPQALRVAFGICLNSQFPTFVWWGPDLINLYNDAYAPVLGGRHPAALGQPARALWADIWPVIGDDVDNVVLRGVPVTRTRQRLVMERNGYPEETYFTYSHSPIPDDRGGIGGLFQVCVDETANVLAERERDRQAEQWQLALDAARLGWWHFDPATNVATYDDRYKEIFGVLGSHQPNDDILRLLHPDDLPGVLDSVRAALDPADPRPYAAEYRLLRDDGSVRWIEAHGKADFAGDGSARRATSLVGTVADVTDRKLADQQLQQLLDRERAARAESERVGRVKDEFLATLSHELRTPLNAILGWAQIVRKSTADAEALADGLATIERNARAQAQIIEDLLDMSRITNGKVRLDVQRLDLSAVVLAAVDTARPAADAKGVRLQVVLDPHAGPASGDPNRMQQVFWNLLSNAVKFTPRGGRVQVVLERVNSSLQVSVTDSGEGIKPEFIPHVFDRFRQQDSTTTRRHGGLGLGLSIVKQLTELHGGSVRVRSEGAGQGSTFTVDLPLTVVHAESPPSADRRHPQRGGGEALSEMPGADDLLAGVKVLVVDDEPDARSLIRRLLEDCGAQVTAVASAAEAMDQLSAVRPDVLVSDIGMPDEDGYSLIRRVRALGPAAGGAVPALALTAYARSEDRVRAMYAGFQSHVPKPVEPAELVMMVASLAGRTGHAGPTTSGPVSDTSGEEH